MKEEEKEEKVVKDGSVLVLCDEEKRGDGEATKKVGEKSGFVLQATAGERRQRRLQGMTYGAALCS